MSIIPHAPTSDVPEPRRLLIALLNQQLADAIDLGLQAKHAHWNVKGPHFVSLHALFDEIAHTLAELIDVVAERAVALGGVAYGTLQSVGTSSRLHAYNVTLQAGRDHLAALGHGMADFAATARAAIDLAAAHGDATTADVFTEVSREADTLLWKLTAHGATDA